MRRSVLALLAVAALLLGLAGAPPSAAALTVRVVNTDGDGVSSRSAPQLAARNGYGAPEGAVVTTVCWTWGDAVGPHANRLWWLVAYAGRQFYAADRFLSTPTVANRPVPGEPQCGAPPPPVVTPPVVTPVTPPVAPPPGRGSYLTRATTVAFCVTGSPHCQPPGSPTVAAQAGVQMVCWIDGARTAVAYATDRWFYVRGGGSVGFVPSSVVARQSAVPHCRTQRDVTVARTAAERAGQVWASAADQALFGAGEWAPGKVGEWAGDCPKLPYVAWRAVGVSPVRGHAIANWRHYAPRATRNASPPVGAIVFFDLTRWGHTAIAVGNGFIATTNGLDDSRAANTIAPLSSKSGLLGWVVP